MQLYEQFEEHPEAIVSIDEFFNPFDHLPVNLILEKTQILPLLMSLITQIEISVENRPILLSALDSLIRLTENKVKEINQYLNKPFILKLYELLENEEYIIISLYLISKLIDISEYTFELFSRNNLFETILQLLEVPNEMVSKFCALICQQSISFLNSNLQIQRAPKFFLNHSFTIDKNPSQTLTIEPDSELSISPVQSNQDSNIESNQKLTENSNQTLTIESNQNLSINTDQGTDVKSESSTPEPERELSFNRTQEITIEPKSTPPTPIKPKTNQDVIIDSQLHSASLATESIPTKKKIYHIIQLLITNCPFDEALFVAKATIPIIIQLESASPSEQLITDCFQFAIELASSESIDDFQVSIAVISELLNTENERVFEFLLEHLEIFSILNTALTCPQKDTQITAIDDICTLIIDVPQSHQIMIDLEIIISLIHISIEASFYTKPKVIEAICRIFFNQESPLHGILIQSPEIFELLILGLSTSGLETQSEIVDCLLHIISMDESSQGANNSILLEAGIIDALNSIIYETDLPQDDEIHKKVDNLISKAKCIKTSLLGKEEDE